ncbi:MAG: restriction endonuclease subunit S [Flavobacteriales bacterium]|nr:restriction endonuclease subunit S [Flavobacteriales bacterium]
MSEWKAMRLGNVTTKIGSGATPRGGSNAYISEGISLIRSQNILDFKFSEDGLAHITEAQGNELSNVVVQEGDVLLNITGDSVARCCRAPQHVLPARVNQHVAIIRADGRQLINGYLFYQLIYQKPELLSIAEMGATRKAITKAAIEQFEVCAPEPDEQRAIAAVLSSLDAKIDLLHRQNKTLEAMAETLFRQWFVEAAEEGWRWVQLSEHIRVHRGLSYTGAGLCGPDEGVPMHNLNSVYEGGGYKYVGIKYYKGEYRERHVIKPGELIITNTEQGHDQLLIGCPAIIPRSSAR